MKHVVGMVAAALTLMPGMVHAQTMEPAQMNVTAQSSEYRFQLDLHVNDAVLAKALPAGWVSNVTAAGPAKDCNLRLIFSNISNFVGPDNKLLGKGSNLLAMLVAPVKSADGTQTGQMVLAAIGQDSSDPGYSPIEQATMAKTTRNTEDTNGTTVVDETWSFVGADGSKVDMHVKYTRKPANRSVSTVNYYSPTDPTNYVSVRTEQQTDITRNMTTMPPDRVMDFSYKVSGGKFGKYLDGSEKTLSWDSQPVYGRVIGTLKK